MEPIPKPKLILCLGGAFNPVHTRHIQAMVMCKRWIEAETGYQVVAGRLAVSTDGYVLQKTRKSRDRCIKSEHRIKMCGLACTDHDWLSPYHRSCGSASECGERTKIDMMKSSGVTDLHIAVVVGADRAVNKSGFAKWHKASKHITICIGRKGETAAARDMFMKDKESGKVKNNHFYFVPEELDNVSSTSVRQRLQDYADKSEAVGQLIREGYITEEQGQYILQNEEDLYMDT